MIYIKSLNIHFPHKCIVNCCEFKALRGAITLITGNSGEGKSCILRALNFEFPLSDYFYDEHSLSTLSQDCQKEHIMRNVFYLKQKVHLLSNLTISQHIAMLQELFSSNYLIDYIINQLELSELLDLYPQQLSGGERVRVALLLGFIKQPDIMILDEPTSSLDSRMSQIVANLIKDYAHSGHIVIVATHDFEMQKVGDSTYYLEGGSLQNINEAKNIDHLKVNQSDSDHKIKSFKKVIPLFKQHHPWYHFFIFLITLVAIVFPTVATELNNVIITNVKNKSEEKVVDHFIVYKHIGNDIRYTYSYDTMEDPISLEELELIKSVNHVKSVEWRYDAFNDYLTPTVLKENRVWSFNSDEIRREFLVLNSDKELIKDCTDPNRTLLIHSYVDNYDYTKDIAIKFQDEGVYISSALAKLYSENKLDWENMYVELTFSIPVHNRSGYQNVSMFDGEDGYYCNSVMGEIGNFTFPVAGVLKGATMDGGPGWDYQIYISQSELTDLLSRYKNEESFVNYTLVKKPNESGEPAKFENFLNKIPDEKDDYDIHLTSYITPWMPNAYTVYVDDIVYLEEVQDEFVSLGFGVESEYLDLSSYQYMLNTFNDTVKGISYIIIFLITIFMLGLMFHNRWEEVSFIQFFRDLGLNKKQIDKLYRMRYNYQIIRVGLFSAISVYVIVGIINIINYPMRTNYSWNMIVMMTTGTLMFAYLIPKIVRRTIK